MPPISPGADDRIEPDARQPLAEIPESPKSSRRRWLATTFGGLTTGILGTALYANRIEPHWVEIVRRDLPIAGLPPRLEGRTLMQLSDLHIGPVVDDAYLIASLDRAAALQPDIVVQTGDLIHSVPVSWPQVDRILDHFPKGRLATVSILGNHDYGRGWSETRAAASVADALTSAGHTVLRDATHEVEGLRITGFEELLGPQWREDRAASLVKHDRPHIVLCHNPEVCDVNLWDASRPASAYQGWVLSGHTHGGQVSVPFYGPPILPVVNKRYTSGEFAVAGGWRLYINRALGYLRRVRFNVRPEITLFTLRAAPSPAHPA
jgi:predicted MPP superfamily phosphohydrolase